MIGAIIGDIVGSPYEFDNINTIDFPLFGRKSFYTDDTILTIAVCDAILKKIPYKESLVWWGNKYPSPYGDYGGRFLRWLKENDPQPYNSWGNGSAMRVSAIGWLYNSVEEVLYQAKLSAEISHSHPEGVKGAQAIASAIFLARTGQPKEAIKRWIEIEFGYNLNNTVANLQQTYANGNFDYESCQDSVPQAILCFLESSDFESAIRLAISIGGDSDTIACMTGGIAEAFYKRIDKSLLNGIWDRIPLDMMLVIDEFIEKTKIKMDYRTTLRYKRQRWYRKIIATVTVIALSVW